MRVRAALLTVLAGAALVAVPAGPAAAAACPQGPGVTVVVDFASLGGGTSTQCAAGDPASGVAALRGAGFTPTRAAQQPGYFLCRIDGKPANDPCQRTSPADAYWSYWHAKPGGSWTYSSDGPANYNPAPGAVEGWAFGAGKPPSTSPPRGTAAAPSPAPTPTPRGSSRPAPAPSRAVPSAVPSRPAAVPTPTNSEAPVDPARSALSAAPSAAPSAALSSEPTPTSSSTDAAVPAAVDRPLSPAGSSVRGPLLAGGLVALLVAGAAAAVVRRRREERS